MIKGKYCIQFNTAYQDYHGDEEVEIGKVINLQTEEVIIYIVYDKNLYKDSGNHTCIYTFEDSPIPAAYVDDLHRECLYNKQDIFFALVMHEYGHYINGDLSRIEYHSNKEVQEDRLDYVVKGKVQEMELKADAFAVSCVGKNTFLRALDYLIASRRKRNDKGMLVAIKEFELRKKAVQKIK